MQICFLLSLLFLSHSHHVFCVSESDSGSVYSGSDNEYNDDDYMPPKNKKLSDQFDLESNDYFTFVPIKNEKSEKDEILKKEKFSEQRREGEMSQNKNLLYRNHPRHIPILNSPTSNKFHHANQNNFQSQSLISSPQYQSLPSHPPSPSVSGLHSPGFLYSPYLKNEQKNNILSRTNSMKRPLLPHRVSTPSVRSPSSYYNQNQHVSLSDTQPLVCPVCSSAFASVKNLKDHLEVHL